MDPALRYPDAPMASLALDTGPRTGPEHPTRHAGELIDFRAVAADLESLAETHSGGPRELRAALAQRLKVALNEGRAKAEFLSRPEELSERLEGAGLSVIKSEALTLPHDVIRISPDIEAAARVMGQSAYNIPIVQAVIATRA